ncbi:MAG: hypothetical protein H5U40_10600, partial [Polyangiaceae bacterium]|nr:hypothetical protein [Polyangiaceae bacterium]
MNALPRSGGGGGTVNVVSEILDADGDFDRPTPQDAMRGAVFIVARTWLRHRGLEDDYLARLPTATRDAIVHAVASDWLPIEHGVAHYVALDAMIS